MNLIKPSVVHCMKTPCTHYCGRKSSYNRCIGSPLDFSILGNPFPMASESEREHVIQQYRVWLWTQIKGKTPVAATLEEIPSGAVLGCWCHPKACHCDVIADAWMWLQSKNYL